MSNPEKGKNFLKEGDIHRTQVLCVPDIWLKSSNCSSTPF